MPCSNGSTPSVDNSVETVENPSRNKKLAINSSKPGPHLGVFVKTPVAGQVKTRLTPPLQPEESARLYAVAMQETISRFATAGFSVVLFYAGACDYFDQNFSSFPLYRQADGDLGVRMREAFLRLLSTESGPVALIGSDSPDLPVDQVRGAYRKLAEHDVVTVPATDGGYVLIGCSRPCPELFDDVNWSTGSVLATTRQRARQFQLRYCEYGGWSDVDDIASLAELLQRSPDSATARFARRQFAAYLSQSE